VFGDLFALPISEGVIAEGESDDRPIKLESILSTDFEAFLKYLYPYSPPSKLETSSISNVPRLHRPDPKTCIPALKLATLWEFDAIREKCIQDLSYGQLDIMEKRFLAILYQVPKWLIEVYADLVKQEDIPSPSVLASLGSENVHRIMRLREGAYIDARQEKHIYTGSMCIDYETNYEMEYRALFREPKRSYRRLDDQIRQEFEAELKDATRTS